MTFAEIISKRGRAACRLLRRKIARLRFAEINLFGVYVAPIPLMMAGAWLVRIALRRLANRSGLLRYVWQPALFVFTAYALSSWILIFDRWSSLP
jgi:protein AaeX